MIRHPWSDRRPERIEPGEIPLLGYDPESDRGSAWWFGRGVPHVAPTPFDDDAKKAWRDAEIALSRSLPLAPPGLREVGRRMPSATLIGRTCAAGRGTRVEAFLGDRSFGLAFALSMASALFGLPLRGVAATGRLLSNGTVGRVTGIDGKVAALLRHLPGVHTLWVPSAPDLVAQARAAVERFGGQLVIRSASSLNDVLGEIFPTLERSFRDRFAGSPQDVDDTVELMLATALGPRDQLVDWTPLEAATRSLESRAALSPAQRNTLTFVREVAARHQGRAPGGLPDDEALNYPAFLGSLPAPMAARGAANAVQLAADTGRPEPQVVDALVESYFECDPERSHPHHLRIRGALARLANSRGEVARAIELTRSAVKAWRRLHDARNVTHPLSFWFVLSALAGIDDATKGAKLFAEADAELDHIRRLGLRQGQEGGRYVASSRARAVLRCGIADKEEEAIQTLASIAEDAEAPEHLQYQLLRELCLHKFRSGASPEVPRLLRERYAAGTATEQETATWNLALVAIERALAGEPLEEDALGLSNRHVIVDADRAVDWLREVQGRWVEFVNSTRGTLGLPQAIIRRFPY